MTEKPLVSIITPSYNQDRFIRATIESVLSQDYENIEYIVVDGGSTDATLDILKEYDEKLHWISEKDNGQSDAINKGFKMAKGEIVAWLNSDDTYELGAITKAVNAFLEDDDIALVYGDGDIIDADGKKVMPFAATQEFDLWTLIHVWDYIMQPATFFSAAALKEVNYLDVDLNWCMDWDLWIKLGLNHRVKYIKEVVANSREYGDTKTSTGGFKRFDEIMGIMRKYGNMKRPPGYYLYGTDTWVKVTQGIPGIHFIAKSISHFAAKTVFQNQWSLYPDQWMGKKYRFIVEPRYSSVDIGFSHVIASGMGIKIYVNDKCEFSSDNFSGQVTESLELKKGQINYIDIIPSKTVSPAGDNRELSVTIDRTDKRR